MKRRVSGGLVLGDGNEKGGSVLMRRFDPDMSSKIFYNAMYHGQSHSGSFSDGFGREKRVENFGKEMFGNPGTGITDDDLHISSGIEGRGELEVAFFNDDGMKVDGQGSAMGAKGMFRIRTEVHDDAMNLNGVGKHHIHLVLISKMQLNV